MGLRRIATGDQRRRRVLIEESLGVVGTAVEGEGERHSVTLAVSEGTSYSDAAALSRQPPSVLVLASRPFTLTVAALSAAVLLAGLLAAYAHWGLWPAGSLPALLTALDLERPGCFAAWFCSLLLAAAAFQGVQIYCLRRHKTDDYRGRYRVWSWIPVVLLAMAAGQATGIHQDLISLAVASLAPTAGLVSATTWPLAAGLLWIIVAARLTVEIRASRWATIFLAMATVGYVAGLVTAQISVQPISRVLIVLCSSALLMTAHLAVFVSVLVFGRHVYLDSQGLLPVRKAAPRRAKSRAQDAAVENKKSRRKALEPDDQSQVEEKNEAKAPNAPQQQPLPAPMLRWEEDTAEAGEPYGADEQDGVAPREKLSKTERRRLKKQRQQEQLRRAA